MHLLNVEQDIANNQESVSNFTLETHTTAMSEDEMLYTRINEAANIHNYKTYTLYEGMRGLLSKSKVERNLLYTWHVARHLTDMPYIDAQLLQEHMKGKCAINLHRAINNQSIEFFSYDKKHNRYYITGWKNLAQQLFERSNIHNIKIFPMQRNVSELESRDMFTFAECRASAERPQKKRKAIFNDNKFVDVYHDRVENFLPGRSTKAISQRTNLDVHSVNNIMSIQKNKFSSFDDTSSYKTVQRHTVISNHRSEDDAISACNSLNYYANKGYHFVRKVVKAVHAHEDKHGNPYYDFARVSKAEIKQYNLNPEECEYELKFYVHYAVCKKLSNSYVSSYAKLNRPLILSSVKSSVTCATHTEQTNDTKARTKASYTKNYVYTNTSTVQNIIQNNFNDLHEYYSNAKSDITRLSVPVSNLYSTMHNNEEKIKIQQEIDAGKHQWKPKQTEDSYSKDAFTTAPIHLNIPLEVLAKHYHYKDYNNSIRMSYSVDDTSSYDNIIHAVNRPKPKLKELPDISSMKVKYLRVPSKLPPLDLLTNAMLSTFEKIMHDEDAPWDERNSYFFTPSLREDYDLVTRPYKDGVDVIARRRYYRPVLSEYEVREWKLAKARSVVEELSDITGCTFDDALHEFITSDPTHNAPQQAEEPEACIDMDKEVKCVKTPSTTFNVVPKGTTTPTPKGAGTCFNMFEDKSSSDEDNKDEVKSKTNRLDNKDERSEECVCSFFPL